MDFIEILSETTKRRRLLGTLAGLLTLGVAFAGLGVALDAPSLTVLAIVVIACVVGIVGKVLTAIAVYLNGTTKRLKVLNDRYDDTEVWLEQFDKGTRATFTNLSRSLKDAGDQRVKLVRLIDSLQADLKAQSEQLEQALHLRATREALDAAVKSTESQSAKLASEVERVIKEHEKFATVGKKVEETEARSKELGRLVEQLQEADDRLVAAIAAAEESLGAKLEEQDRLRKAGQQTIIKEALDSARQEIAKSTDRIEAIDKNLKSASSLTGRLRGEGYAQFGRLIGADFIKEIQGDFGKKLGVDISQREVRYLERKVQHLEALCEGRMATTAEDAVARVLAARSQRGDELKILEIGVLFGVSAALMHTALSPFFKQVRLVLLDPFDGYYGSDHLDPLTGQKVSRAAVERNLTRATIRSDDVEILEGFSTDDKIMHAAQSQGPYDVLVIDGDHTYDGVKADFERYADMVSPGGVLIVDDYGSDDWPDVTKYVDDIVKSDKRFEQVGTLSRTAIFKRTGMPSKKQVDKKEVIVKDESSVSVENHTPEVKTKPTPTKSARKAATKKVPAKASPTKAPESAKRQAENGDDAAEPIVVETRSAKKVSSRKKQSASRAKQATGTRTDE
ncbi:MAG: class I SAM-dependent methyltransferase [Phycisphaerales bacterium]|nr:class I SAM-dependent methyltransferase [Phycisphaerales bacterium]